MTARFLNHEFFTFIPVGKIWIATNNKPKIVGTDEGIWRRIHMIPFIQKFEGGNLNKKLKDQLREELPGILNWVIRGAGLWFRDGLNPPDTVKAATAAYRQERNPITPFVEACCITGQTLQMQGGPKQSVQADRVIYRGNLAVTWVVMAASVMPLPINTSSRKRRFV